MTMMSRRNDRRRNWSCAFQISWLLGLVFALGLSNAARGDEIILKTGDRILCTIVEVTDAGYVVDHPVFGRLVVPRDQIESFTIGDPVDVQAGEQGAPAESLEPSGQETSTSDAPEGVETEILEEEDEAPEKNWALHFDLGLANVSGNTNERVVTGAVLFERKTDLSELTIDLNYYWKESDNEVTDNKLSSGVRYDWLNPDQRWFFFTQGRYDFDEFESWQQRVTAHAGPGYRVIDQDELNFSLRAGAGGRREFGSENDELSPEALFGLDFSWQIDRRNSLTIAATYFPALDDFFDDYRTREVIRWRYKLDDHLSVALGLAHEYQNVVDPGKDRNDLRITLSLGLDF